MWKTICKCPQNKSYSYVVYDTIDAVEVIHWNTLNTTNNIYLSSRYLRALEMGMKGKMSFRYLIFYNDKKEAVGISVFQIIRFKPGELLQDRIPCTIADKIQAFFLEDKELKLLICGNLYACGENGFAHNNAITSPKFIEIVSEAISEMKHIKTDTTKISFSLFKEFWPSSSVLDTTLEKAAFNDFNIDVNMILKIQDSWSDFEGYLNAMNSKYRTRAKSVLKKSKPIVKRELAPEEIQFHIGTIKRLYEEVLSKADYNLGVLHPSTFIALKKELQENFSFVGYFLDSKLIGFTSAFIFNDVVDANFVGIDYTYNNGYKLYQRMLYDYVFLAIEHKKIELRLGRTAETSKSGVGASPVEMKLYVRHRNKIPSKLMQPLVGAITPDTFELRKPFK